MILLYPLALSLSPSFYYSISWRERREGNIVRWRKTPNKIKWRDSLRLWFYRRSNYSPRGRELMRATAGQREIWYTFPGSRLRMTSAPLRRTTTSTVIVWASLRRHSQKRAQGVFLMKIACLIKRRGLLEPCSRTASFFGFEYKRSQANIAS